MTVHRFIRRVAVVGALVAAVAAGALAPTGNSTARPTAENSPAPSTSALNQRYAACLKANGASWTRIANSGGMYRVDIPLAATEACSGLDLAREAAGQGDARTAAWLTRVGPAPASFWACISAAGYHVSGGTGQRSDYGSSAFADTAGACAASAGVTLPAK
jgi:hypothetical protein